MQLRTLTLNLAAMLVLCGLARGESSELVLGDGLQPQVAVGAAGDAFVVHALGGAISVSTTDGGGKFGEAVLVEKVAGLPLGMRRGPRIAAAGDAVVVTAISGPKGGGKDGDVFAWVSRDKARTWMRIRKPLNTASGSAREGMHSMAAGSDGTVICVWLDLRNAKPGKPGTEVWCAVSSDGGRTWSADRVVHRNPGGTVCECCHPSVIIDGKGLITVMFRNALDGARDMYITSSKDGGKTFAAATKLGGRSWQIAACPMDGGSLASAGDITTIWRREGNLYLSAAGQPEQFIAKGSHPVIAAVDQGHYALWMDGRGLRLKAPGKPAADFTPSGSYPAVAASLDGKGPVVAAWERDGKVVVKTIQAR